MDSKRRNRPWKKIITGGIAGIALASLVPLSAQAWNGRRGGPDPDRAVEKLTEELQLTEEQQSQVRSILEEQMSEREEMRRSHWEERDAHRAATEERLAEVLTAEQMDGLQQMREDRPQRRKDRRCNEDGRGRPCDQVDRDRRCKQDCW